MITFTPTALTVYSGQQKLIYNNGYISNYVSSLNLSGNGKAKLTFNQSTYNFGQVIQTKTTESTITVSNPGATIFSNLSPAVLNPPYSFKGGSFPGMGGTCSSTLAAGANCTMVVVFSPTTTGVSTQTLSLTYDDGYVTGTQSSASLTGEGIAQAIISLSDSNPFNFGTTTVNGTIDKTFTLTNAGSVPGTSLALSFTSVFKFRGGSFPGTSGTCATTLNAGATCTIVVSFTPTAALAYSGTMTLNYNDGIRTQTELKDLQGSGSANLNRDYYLSLIPLKSFNELELESLIEKQNYKAIFKKFKINDFSLSVFLNKRIIYFGTHGPSVKKTYRIYNNFDENIHQGLATIFLENQKILSGIYQKQDDFWMLCGYTIYNQLTGHTLEQLGCHN